MRGKQVILFINRRGFATSVHCRECGLVVRCRRCEVTLIYHGAKGKLVCHHCGYNIRKPQMCRGCGSPDLWVFGHGYAAARGRDAAEISQCQDIPMGPGLDL